MESILTSIKKLLGIDSAYTHFDADIIIHIISVFAILSSALALLRAFVSAGLAKPGIHISAMRNCWTT